MQIGKKIRLEPTKEQIDIFFRFAGTNRFAWNTCKAFYDNLWKEKQEYATVAMLMKHLQNLKHNDPDFVWLKEVPEAITKQAIKDLIKAYQTFYEKRKENGFDKEDPNKFKPKFKKKGKCKPSFYQRTDNIRKTDNTHVKLTGVKKPVKCSNLKDVDLPEKIQNPRISFDGKYWYLSYAYEVDNLEPVVPEREKLGIDLGIKELAITSNHCKYGNINKDMVIKKLRKHLKHLQRDVSRKYEANATYDFEHKKKIYHKTKNIEKLERKIKLIHRRIANIQKTYMYEVIKDVMKTKSRIITIEDLNVKGMMQNPKLAKAIQEQSFYEFRRILAYKCDWHGIELRAADRWYPSSKKCSCCGNIKQDLKLKDRTYECEVCGLVIDRDENASLCLEDCDDYKIIVPKIKIA